MLKSRLVKPTLFLVVSILIFVYMLFEWIASGRTVEGWVYRMVNLLLPVAIGMLIADLLLKYFVRSLKAIWIVEVLLLLGVIYYWIVS